MTNLRFPNGMMLIDILGGGGAESSIDQIILGKLFIIYPALIDYQ